MKFIAGLIGGLVLAVMGGLLVTITFAASPGSAGFGAIAFFAFWVVGFIIALTADRAGKAWRRLLITSALFAFLAPIAGIVFTGTVMATQVDTTSEFSGAEAAGAAIGGGLVSGLLGFVGFFLGLVFLVIGLLVGRDKEIVYIEKQSSVSETH